MVSKLDELMALADEYWSHGTHETLAHADGGGYDVEKIFASRTALQDALKAVVEDAQLAKAETRALSEALDRTWHVLKKHGKHPGRTDDTIWDCVDAAIDAARKP